MGVHLYWACMRGRGHSRQAKPGRVEQAQRFQQAGKEHQGLPVDIEAIVVSYRLLVEPLRLFHPTVLLCIEESRIKSR